MSVEIEGFLGYGVVVSKDDCRKVCENFIDTVDRYQNEIINLNYYTDNSPIFFGVSLTENDLNRAMLNPNLVQEWKHKTWVAYHRVFAADIEMPESRFIFTTRYW